jgi:glycosyltransferase involved in cell wall biosynthesis
MRSLVSVVIPTFNYGQFLGGAIDSVLAQTYSEIECIVVDDGSTDQTPGVLAAYGSAVRMLRQATQGPSAARNTGIRAARGRYIAFLDADDRWTKEKLTRQVAVLDADAETAAVGCRATFVTATGDIIGHRDFAERASAPIDLTTQLKRVAVRDFWVGGSASGAVIRREVFDAVGLWDEALPSAEDWDLWMRIAARYGIYNVPERLVTITLHGTGTWRNPGKREGNQWKACDAALQRWPDALESVRRRMHALILADVGGEYVDAGDTRLALSRYFSSLRQWPWDGSRWRAVASLTLKRLLGR